MICVEYLAHTVTHDTTRNVHMQRQQPSLLTTPAATVALACSGTKSSRNGRNAERISANFIHSQKYQTRRLRNSKRPGIFRQTRPGTVVRVSILSILPGPAS